jgi:hypothetical protein
MLYVNDTTNVISETTPSDQKDKIMAHANKNRDKTTNCLCYITDNISRAISFKRDFNDKAKVILILPEMSEDILDAPDEVFICCYSLDQVNEYINTKDSYAAYKYKFIGNTGCYKYWYHLFFKGASFVQSSRADFVLKEASLKRSLLIINQDMVAQTSNIIQTRILLGCVSKDKLSQLKNTPLNRYLPATVHKPIFDGTIYIMKPTNTRFAFKGSGITVFTNESEYREGLLKIDEMRKKDKNTSYLIQEYIDNPLLFSVDGNEGLKFHFRVFMKLGIKDNATSYSYFHKFRTCTSKEPFKKEDFLNPSIHDTHLSSTKDEYIYCINDEVSEFDCLNIINKEAVNAMIKCVYDMIKYFKALQKFNDTKTAYTVLGLDVMIRDNGEPCLLEINTSPSVAPINFGPTYLDFVQEYTQWVLGPI